MNLQVHSSTDKEVIEFLKALLKAKHSDKFLRCKYLDRFGSQETKDRCSGALLTVALAFNGRLEALKWARANGFNWSVWTCAWAAQNGHLDVLIWARTNGCPWDELTCAQAAENGHLDVIVWARTNGCPWDKLACEFAALNGHLDVLIWARTNGCPWDEWTCARAAQNGHLNVIEYLYDEQAPYFVYYGIHSNCKEFFELYKKSWKSGEFIQRHPMKPARG